MAAVHERPPRAPWVLVASGFHWRGGMEKANAALAEYLHRRGDPLHLVTHDADPEWSGSPGVTVHRVERPMGSLFLGQFALDRRGREVAGRVLRDAPAARVVVNGGNCLWPDLNWVHMVHHVGGPADAGAPLSFRLRNRLVLRINRRRERVALEQARLVIANSERTRDDILRHLDVEPDRVRTIYLGTDPTWGPPDPAERAAARAWLGEPGERPIVAFVGALGYDHRKGMDTLFEAWRDLVAGGGWDARLVVAGGGRMVPVWRERFEAAAVGDHVQFLGFTDEIPRVLAAADLMVSPVRYEPYGLNVQEAICRGVPALVSASAGVAERYPPELREMLLRDPEDAGELRERLVGWRASVAEWRERFLPLSRTLRDSSWSHMAERIVALAEE